MDDHAPAHVHAVGAGEASADITGSAPRLIEVQGFTRAEVRRVMKIVEQQQAALLLRWKDIHG
ncbi:DUF4160 domain-containing protein [Sphingobium baderi]|uniref:DUF4160 domain-containing protein n=1 Tax=Sphingobium TaxID=165695 RepID=UPI0018D200B7